MDYKGLNFFGTYLLHKGLISPEDLKEAIAFQEESNRRIGEIARERGYLSAPQVDAIFQEQKKVDQPFGAIALRQGYLSRSQLDDLLFAQTVFSTHLGEALLIKGFITPEQFSEELNAFREEQIRREHKLYTILKDLPEKDIFQALVSSVNRAFLRFWGRELKVDSLCHKPEATYDLRFVVRAATRSQGEVACTVFLTPALAEALSEGFRKHTPQDCTDDCVNRLRGFFEIVARYLCVALEELEIPVERCTAEGGLLPHPAPVPLDRGLVIQLATPLGPIVLHLQVGTSEDEAPCQDAAH